MPLTPVTYFTYSELLQELRPTLEQFHAELAKFSRNEVIYVCSVLNAILKNWQGHLDEGAHEILVRDSLPQKVADYVISSCRNVDETRGLYHRQQLLFVAKEAIRVCQQSGINPIALPFWGGFGFVLLMANDLLPKRLTHPGDIQSQMISVMAEMIPVAEASGFYRAVNKVVRAYLMFSKFLPDSDLAISDIFKSSTGVTLETYQALTFATLTRYHDISWDKYKSAPGDFLLNQQWFRNIAVPSEITSAFLSDISGSIEDLQQAVQSSKGGVLDFTCFKEKPIFRDGDVFFVIDAAFLAEKAETGPFWRVQRGLKPENRLTFHSRWGGAFERYINWLLGESVDRDKNTLHPNPRFEDNDEEVCDAIVICGNSAVFIESKGNIFTAEGKYGNDPHRLEQEIEEKLVTKRGASQLARNIQQAFDKKSPRRIRGVDVMKISKVLPVLVTRDDIGAALVMNAYLARRFREMFDRKAVRVTVTPVFSLSAQDLELICAYLRDVSLTDLLEERYRNDSALLSSFWLVPNRIIEQCGDRRCEAFSKSFHEYMRMVESVLFKKAED